MWKRWNNSSYRVEQIKKLSSKMRQINPHIPFPENMIVVAKGICMENLTKPSLTSGEASVRTSVSNSVTSERRSSNMPSFDVHEIPRMSFEINGVQISDKDTFQDPSRIIRFIFDPDQPLQYVKILNKGVTTLRFRWTKFEKFRIFHNILPVGGLRSSPFYFDNNDILLVPGKMVELPVWCRATTAGTFYETWELTTIPKFWEPEFQLLMYFEVTIFHEDNCWKTIKDLIDARTRNSLIKEILNGLLNALKYEDQPSISYTFTEEMLFENANKEYWGLTKRNKYVYKKEIVDDMIRLYNDVRQPGDPISWNYSITELEQMVRKKDIIDFCNRQIKKCEKSRERIKSLKYMYEPSAINLKTISKLNQSNKSIVDNGESKIPHFSNSLVNFKSFKL